MTPTRRPNIRCTRTAATDRAAARLLPPESAALDVVAQEVGIGAGTLERAGETMRGPGPSGRGHGPPHD